MVQLFLDANIDPVSSSYSIDQSGALSILFFDQSKVGLYKCISNRKGKTLKHVFVNISGSIILLYIHYFCLHHRKETFLNLVREMYRMWFYPVKCC